jgi:hypothetical protein
VNKSAMVVAAMLPGIIEARISRTSHQREVMASDLDDCDVPVGNYTPAAIRRHASRSRLPAKNRST